MKRRIKLSWSEMFCACVVGVVRRMSSIAKGLDAKKHADRSDFQTDIEGAIAEACFAKHHDHYWSCSVNTFKLPDVSEWQVRSTGHRNGHLIIRPNDELPEEHFALVITDTTSTSAYFGGDIIGWMKACEAQVDRYWRDDMNSWWVPQSDLHLFTD